MPTYGYGCRKCEAEFEVVQRITDEPLTVHEGCGGELRRLLYPVGIVFKGPGFHVNDYGRGNKGSNGKSGNGTGEKSESATEKPVESKPEAKTETKAAPETPKTPAEKSK